MTSPVDEELSSLITLLDQKKSLDCPLQTQQIFYSRCHKFFKSNPDCIWCRYTPLAVECLHLFGLPPNPLTDSYIQITKNCLLNCSNCITAYYVERPEFVKNLKEHFEIAALEAFLGKIRSFDLDRLSSVLKGFLSSSLHNTDSNLLYTLYEILSYPVWMDDPHLDELMCGAMSCLIEQKKMLKVSQPMPGIFYLLFHRSEQIRLWAISVLDQKLQTSPKFLPEALNIEEVYKRSSNYLSRYDFWKSVACLIYKFPVSELSKSSRWISEILKDLDLSNDSVPFVLSAYFSRYFEEKDFRAFEFSPVKVLFKHVLSNKAFLANFDKHAEYMSSPPDTVLSLTLEQAYSNWLLLVNQMVVAEKDCAFLELMVECYLHVFPLLSSAKSQHVFFSILADLIRRCLQLDGEKFYMKSIFRCLEYLMVFFFRTSTSGKMSLSLLETVKIALQFDLKDIRYYASLETFNENDLNTSLYQALLSVFTKFPQDKELYVVIQNHCNEIFLKDDDKIIAISLSTRKYLLTYLMNEWTDRGKNSDFADQKNVMLMLFAISVSTGVLKAQIIPNALTAHPGQFITSMSGFVKTLSKLNTPILSPLLMRLGFYFKILNQVIFPKASKSLIDELGNVLYLKLHVISFSASILTMISLQKDSKQEVWSTFFSVCETFWFAFRSLGLDALKQCLRENLGLSRRMKPLGGWLLFFFKHCMIMSPIENARLVPFVSALIKLSVFLKTAVLGVEGQMGRYLGNFKEPSDDLDELQQAMWAYEKEFSVSFKVQVPARKSREPLTVKLNPVPLVSSNAPASVSIEDLFLKALKEESQANTEKPLRISNQLPLRLSNLPHSNEVPIGRALPTVSAPAKPTSKLGQLKSELVKEMATLPAIKTVKRPVNPLLTTTAKAPKLATHELSSDYDSEDEHMDGFHKEVAEINHTARHDQPQRSVKLISLEEVGVNVVKPSSNEEEDYVPVDMAKKLQRHVLELDFDGLDDRSIEGSGAMSIPDAFDDVEHYLKVFEPLLLFECRSQLFQAKLELDSMHIFDLKVASIASVDDFHDVTVLCDCEEGQRVVTENDTILVKLDRHQSDSKVLGIVTKAVQNGRNCEATVRFLFKPQQSHLQVQLRIGLIWHAKKLCNWITAIREYSALHSFQNFRLNKAIMKPSYVPINEQACETAAGILETSLGLNRSQAQAVAVALNNTNPFTLIKGPPGTGKTSTIQGLVGAIFGRPYPSSPAVVKPPRILICAPSNAAIDEIVRRLKAGIYDCYHVKFTPRIVRIGSQEMIHEEVKDLTLDAVVEKTFLSSCKESLELLKKQKAEVSQLKKDLDFAETDQRQAEKLQDLKKALWTAKENLKKNTVYIENTRHSLRTKVLNDAQVVCTTLSSSGIELLSKMQFPFVIIDEACQAVELSALVPLQYGCQNCVLVGDPNQLPPTVISQAASLFAYEQSLFQRLMKSCPESVQLLSVQYRMHPDISVFPNRYFYEGRLTDGPGLAALNTRPWHQARGLGPYRFFDIPGQEQNQMRRSGNQGTSKLNELEAQSVMNLIAHICTSSPEINFCGKIGIVTPYKEQRRALKRAFGRHFGHHALSSVEISTVDGYQGQEKEIIIFSCVRTGSSHGIGFLNDARRLNVAITRAKTSLFILGKSSALLQNELWRGLIQDAKERNCFRAYDHEIWREWQRLPHPHNLVPPPPPLPAKATPPRAIENRTAAAKPQKIKGPMQRRMEAAAAVQKPNPQ